VGLWGAGGFWEACCSPVADKSGNLPTDKQQPEPIAQPPPVRASIAHLSSIDPEICPSRYTSSVLLLIYGHIRPDLAHPPNILSRNTRDGFAGHRTRTNTTFHWRTLG
jgi:hypothetical protein